MYYSLLSLLDFGCVFDVRKVSLKEKTFTELKRIEVLISGLPTLNNDFLLTLCSQVVATK